MVREEVQKVDLELIFTMKRHFSFSAVRSKGVIECACIDFTPIFGAIFVFCKATNSTGC